MDGSASTAQAQKPLIRLVPGRRFPRRWSATSPGCYAVCRSVRGLTCLWQVRGRSDLGFEEWMRLDLEYVDRLSLGLDLEILARTLPAVLSARGAY